MVDNEVERTGEDAEGETEAEAPAAAEADKDVDKVKPVVFIGLFITALLGLGVFDFFQNMEPNGCSMTYMFEFPKYINMQLPVEVNQTFPKYRLFAYGEGEDKNIEKLSAEHFDGIPVLFIPGNSGSHKQVRSLASVALRKAIDDSDYKVHFDYFTVDFGEEYSALYGGVLQDQVMFVSHCIEKILQLYQGRAVGKVPTSVVLVGHSMGGLIAKALFTEPQSLSPSLVQVIITLATPHTPVLILDRETHLFYNKIDSFWSESRATILSHITLVSIGGGLRDVQVRAGLTQDSQADININSNAASSAWVSTDHQCIVWCKQLALTINRALFDMIDLTSKQITIDNNLRKDILHYHLKDRSAGKKYQTGNLHPATIAFDSTGHWSEIVKRQFTFSKGSVAGNLYSLIKIDIDDPNKRFLTLDAVRMSADDWVFGCKETKLYKDSLVCEEGENLSSKSSIIPSKGKRKAINLSMIKMKKLGYSHIVVHTPVYTEDTRVNIDVFNPRERRISYAVPKWINFWRQFTVVEKTVAGAVFYNLSLTGIDNPWQAYVVTAVQSKCAATEEEKPHFGLARFITPWANDATHVLLGKGEPNSITAKLQTPRPTGSNDTLETPQIHFYLDPACTYAIKVYPSIPQMMGQMIRFYAPLVLPCMVACIILILAFQMRRIEGSRFCQSTLLTLMSAVSPVNVVLPSKMVAYILALGPLVAYFPRNDIEILQSSGLDFGILPIMMFFSSIGLVFLLTCLTWGTILLGGSLAHKAVMRWATTVSPHEVVADVAVSTLEKFPSVLASILIALGFATCGSLALCLGCFCYFLKLFKMYQEYLETLVKRAVGLREEDDPYILLGVNFQFTLALLWLMSTLLNLPTLLTWCQNLPLSLPLPADPSLIHAVILCASLSILWQNEGKPRVEKKYFSVMAIILQGVAIFIATFAMVTIYRLSFAISAVFLVVSIHQLISPARQQEAEEEAVE